MNYQNYRFENSDNVKHCIRCGYLFGTNLAHCKGFWRRFLVNLAVSTLILTITFITTDCKSHKQAEFSKKLSEGKVVRVIVTQNYEPASKVSLPYMEWALV